MSRATVTGEMQTLAACSSIHAAFMSVLQIPPSRATVTGEMQTLAACSSIHAAFMSILQIPPTVKVAVTLMVRLCFDTS